MTATDADVITASVRKPAEFGVIFDRHAAAVLRFFVRRIGPDDAGGLVGEVFRIAFERRGSFDAAYASALPWLYGIATRLLANHRRSQTRRLQATSRFAAESASPVANSTAPDASLMLTTLAGELQALPDGERAALLLFALEEMSYEAIAVALDIPTGTVRSRINRARKRLRSALEGGTHEE